MGISTDIIRVESEELAERVRDALADDFAEHTFELEPEGLRRFVVCVRGVPDYPARTQMISKARRMLERAREDEHARR